MMTSANSNMEMKSGQGQHLYSSYMDLTTLHKFIPMQTSMKSKMASDICKVLTVLVSILILSADVNAQNCDYLTGTVSFNAQGQNITELYTTNYALTDVSGNIIQLADSPEFTIDVSGFYIIYGINYKNDTDVSGLSVGSNIYIVVGDCLDISVGMPITVCESLDPCNYCLGENVVLQSSDENQDAGFITEYILTDQNGTIINIQDTPEYDTLDMGLYIAFALNYEIAEGVTGLELGESIYDIQGTCKEISNGYIFGICQSLDPIIFFDLKGCDITETALLQVDEVYDNYLWNTGSTRSFIEIDANDPAVYTVTVSLNSGCIGVRSQTITGNEVSTIGDFVWEDLNADGIQDDDEAGINGIVVNLFTDFNNDGRPDFPDFPSCVTTTSNHPTTGQPGYYNFNIYQSTYIVGFEGPQGFTISESAQGNDPNIDSDIDPLTGWSGPIVVSPGQTITSIDAGFYTSSGLGGIVWNDTNGDGVQDEGEIGINDVVINLYDGTGMIVATTITLTDPNSDIVGSYCFVELTPGSYYTEIILPDDNVLSPPNRRADDDIDSDGDGANGLNTTILYTLDPGEKVNNVDFGIYLGGRVCGIVWKESPTLENNVYDADSDELISDSQLELISIDQGGLVVDIVSTNDDGAYCFANIPMGSYQIRPLASNISQSFVAMNQGDDVLLDSDIDPNTLATDVFFLSPSQEILGVNAGLRNGVVPIELISFTGRWDKAKNVNRLEWQTASEINNEKFEIERAIGSSGGFVKIDEVEGNGTSTDVLSYEYVDADIALSGTYYYRLRQVDYDGGFDYSEIIAIDIERNRFVNVKLYPNPASNIITVDLSIEEGATYTADLFDINGKRVANWQSQNINRGHSQLSMDVSNIQMGQYLLSVRVGTQETNQLILITR